MNTVEFPGLGLNIEINKVAFKIFGLPIYWYGMILATALFAAVLLGMRRSKKEGIKPEDVIDLTIFGAIAGIVCARLYYVIFNFSEFKDDLLKVFNTRMGGLAIYGALIGAVIAAFFVARYKKIKPLHLFDFAIPYVVLAQAIGRWGNFVNMEAFGTSTDLPWRMSLPGVGDVHPTFLYESLWDLGVFLILIWFRNRKKIEGEVFCMYLVLYGLGRAWIEGLRTDSLMLGTIRVSQLLSVLLVVAGVVIILERRRRASILAADSNVTIGQSEYGSVLEKLKHEDTIETEQETTESSDASETEDEVNDEAKDEVKDEAIDEAKVKDSSDANKEDSTENKGDNE